MQIPPKIQILRGQPLPELHDLELCPVRMPRVKLKDQINAVPVHLSNQQGMIRWMSDLTKRVQKLLGPCPVDVSDLDTPNYKHVNTIAKTWILNSDKSFVYFLHNLLVEVDKGSHMLPLRILIPGKGCLLHREPPLALVLHPYSENYGVKLVTEATPYPDHAIGPELVKQGYVVIAPQYPLISSSYAPELDVLGYKSTLMRAIVDNMLSISVARQYCQLDSSRVFAVGHSLGGLNSLLTAFFDTRIQAVVASSAFKCLAHRTQSDILDYSNAHYMSRLASYRTAGTEPFDFSEILAALAPRLCVLNAPTLDEYTPSESLAWAYQQALPLYRKFGVGENLVLLQPDEQHVFGRRAREFSYRLLGEHFKIDERLL
jgi:Prolyl oligopeptidase family